MAKTFALLSPNDEDVMARAHRIRRLMLAWLSAGALGHLSKGLPQSLTPSKQHTTTEEENMISVSCRCERGRKHHENRFSLHTSMFPLPVQEEVLHRKTLNWNAQSIHKFINIFGTSRNTVNSPCSMDFRWGTTLCFSPDYEVLEANVHINMISQESKHCFRDTCKCKYSDKEPKLGNEHFGPLGSTYHNQCLVTLSIVSLYRLL